MPLLDAEVAGRGSLEFRVMPASNGAPFGDLGIGLGDGTTSQFMRVSGSRAQDQPGPRWLDRRGAPEEITRQFPLPPNLGSSPAGSTAEVLDALCLAFGYQWRYEGGIYRFRSAAWYLERATEPPGTLVKAVEPARKEQRNLELPWLAAAARVEPARLEKLWLHAPAAMPVVVRSQGLLRFFGTLPAETAARATLRLEETKEVARWLFTLEAGIVEGRVPFPSPAASPFGRGAFGGGAFGPPPGGFPMPPGGFTPPKN